MRCTELATRFPVPRLLAKARANLGEIARLTGDVPGALRYHDSVEEIFREIGPGLVPRTQIDQARVLLEAGLAEEAARRLDEALPVLRAPADQPGSRRGGARPAPRPR